MVTLTENAIKELKKIASEKADEGQGLRLFVEGGCCGRSYGMGFDNVSAVDHVLDQGGLKILINPANAAELKGLVIDCISTPEGPAFEILSSQEEEGGCCGGGHCESHSEERAHGGGCCRG